MSLGEARAQAPAPAQGPRGDLAQLRFQIRDQIRQAAVQRLVGGLALDAGTAAKVTATFKRYGDQLEPLRRETQQARRALMQQMHAGGGDDKALAPQLDLLLDRRAKINRLNEDRARELRKQLTPTQYARLMLAWPRVQRELRMEVMQAIGGRGGGMGWGGHGGGFEHGMGPGGPGGPGHGGWGPGMRGPGGPGMGPGGPGGGPGMGPGGPGGPGMRGPGGPGGGPGAGPGGPGGPFGMNEPPGGGPLAEGPMAGDGDLLGEGDDVL